MIPRSCDGHMILRSCDGHMILRSCDGHMILRSCDGHMILRSCDGHMIPKSCDDHMIPRSCDGHMICCDYHMMGHVTVTCSSGAEDINLEELGSSVSDTGPLDVEHSSRGVSPQYHSNASSTCNLDQAIDYAPLMGDKEQNEQEEEEESKDRFPLRQVHSESDLLEFSMSEETTGEMVRQPDAVDRRSLVPTPLPSHHPSLPPPPLLPLIIFHSPTTRQSKSRARTDWSPTKERWLCATVAGAKAQSSPSL